MSKRSPRKSAVDKSQAQVMRATAEALGIKIDAKGKAASVGLDAFTNQLARMGEYTPSVAEGADYVLVRRSLDYWLMITLYRNHWIARRIVEGPAKDMTRAWAKLSGDMDPDDISMFNREVQRSFTPQRVQQAIKWANLFGGGGCLMVIDGHEEILDKPLDLDDVNPGTYRGLITFDRWSGITPENNICGDIKRPIDFGLPEYYRISPERGGSFKVHASRILRFSGPDIPRPETGAMSWWGISKLEVVFDELRKRDNASWAILQLMFRAQILTQVNDNLAQMLSGAAGSTEAANAFFQRMQVQNEMLSNQSMLILPKDGKLEAHQYTFGGVADVYQQFQLDIAGAAGMPVSRLFGRTITGLGQSNDADEKLYEERIAQDQDEELRPQLQKLYPVISMSLFGEVSDDLDFTFPSVRVLTEKEKAELAKDGVAAIVEAYNAGITTHKSALKDLKQLGDTTQIFTNITDEDIEAADDDFLPTGDLMGGGEGGAETDELDEPTETPAKPAKKPAGKKKAGKK